MQFPWTSNTPQTTTRPRKSEVTSLSLSELMIIVNFALTVGLGIALAQVAELDKGFKDIFGLGVASAQNADTARKLYPFVTGQPYPSEPKDTEKHPLEEDIKPVSSLIEGLEGLLQSPANEPVMGYDTLPDALSDLTQRRTKDQDLAKELGLSLEEGTNLVPTLKAKLAAGEAAKKQIERLRNTLDNTRTDLARVQSDLDASTAYINTVRARYGAASCFNDRAGKLLYLLDIKVYNETLVVSPNWPAWKADEIARLDLTRLEPETRFSAQGFKNHFRPLYDDGEAQNPKCRYYVKVSDRTGNTNKKAWQDGLQTVEDIFYKKVVP